MDHATAHAVKTHAAGLASDDPDRRRIAEKHLAAVGTPAPVEAAPVEAVEVEAAAAPKARRR